jgi:two-component system, NtrC family, sensor kinase
MKNSNTSIKSLQKILIVDDIQENLILLQRTLGIEEYEFFVASSGKQAIEIVSLELPDLILLDVMMPGLNGFETCKEIKKIKGAEDVPIIFITAKTDGEDISEGFAVGGIDYITKPIRQAEVTARVNTHLKTRKLISELKTTVKELEATQLHLIRSEKLVALGQLASGIAHEINNPIGYVLSNVNTLSDYIRTIKKQLGHFQNYYNLTENKGSPTDKVQAAQSITENSEDVSYILSDINELISESTSGMNRVVDIVTGLSSFARADNNKEEEADINFCIKSTLKVINNKIKDHCQLKEQYGNLPLTYCYPDKLNQVFLNLLVNASHAIEEKGIITIETYQTNSNIVIKISDTGSGIKPEDLNQIFNPFFTTKPIGKGTGLGLSISYGIINDHHGNIEVASTPGKGTTFTITLPIMKCQHSLNNMSADNVKQHKA